MVRLFALACGILVANIYYAQPLAGPIGAELGLPATATGLIVTMTQVGYGLGLLLIVPLGDLIENRRLIVSVIALDVLAILGIAAAGAPGPFLAAAFLVGLFSVVAQIIVPLAAQLSPDATRGQTVGNVMSGLLLGIMLARPVSSFVTELSSWHVIFIASAVAMTALAVALRIWLPERRPASGLSYGGLLLSLARLFAETPVLRRRAFYHALMFAAFSLFWTATPLLLAGPLYGLSQGGIALFAFAGVAGAVAAPLAGRLADRGRTRMATAAAMACAALAFPMTFAAEPGSALALGLLVAAGILLDFGVSANLVLGQRAIFSLAAAYRSRLNGLYMAIFFAGGAIGSAAGAWAFASGGWPLCAATGFAFPIAALIYFATER
ncbi:MFS transporter [Rhodomicrobium lacus]|uniref:MFS transporter n=1 Tax=Rhodomicrobium lacus TaxID=2498452 RepID=UPI0026E2E2C9|nr:MFS transporter [Rhodomicrobium lacus]WKW52551.1 MFS transporter [Rhodomicrobium lacus]